MTGGKGPAQAPSNAAPDTAISIRNLRKEYTRGDSAVSDLTIDIRRGEFVCLIGPSGCGKTTTLKMINRLIEPSSGDIFVEGVDARNTKPVDLRRGIGYVIQQVGLFPHKTVSENVSSVLKLLGQPRAVRRRRANEMLSLVGLDPLIYADRYPAQLSGGQQQRVGVARALAADPPVLLMDEPFSAIDPIARSKLQEAFLDIQHRVHKTVVMVTHDIDESLLLADRIAILSTRGTLEQYDTPQNILARPANAFVTAFLGADKGIRQLSVTKIPVRRLEPVPSGLAITGLLDGKDATWPPLLLAEFDHHFGESFRARPNRPHNAEKALSAPEARPVPVSDLVIGEDSTLREALSKILQNDHEWLLVTDREGKRPLGIVTAGAIHTLLREGSSTSGQASGNRAEDSGTEPGS